jgi:oxalate decarboxylase/phosphoglucose isomerase-like protein (cupin superfamily)
LQIRIIFDVAETVASALVTVRPGGLREMHWHPNADEWLYIVKGKAQVTVFSAGPNAVTTNFSPGDIGYILRGNGHYIKNVGDSGLVFLEVFIAIGEYAVQGKARMLAILNQESDPRWSRSKPPFEVVRHSYPCPGSIGMTERLIAIAEKRKRECPSNPDRGAALEA